MDKRLSFSGLGTPFRWRNMAEANEFERKERKKVKSGKTEQPPASGSVAITLPGSVQPRRRVVRKIGTTSVLIALLMLVAGCTGRPDGVEPVIYFDISRYTGTWFEIMRLDHSFERGLTNVTATYELRDDGTVSVLNRGFDRNKCAWDEADGTARFQGDKTLASLSVTFFWPFAGGYHVFELDQDNYAYAVVAGPSRKYLWILARRPDLPSETRNDLVSKARDRGFPVAELLLVDHNDPTCNTNGNNY